MSTKLNASTKVYFPVPFGPNRQAEHRMYGAIELSDGKENYSLRFVPSLADIEIDCRSANDR